LWLQRAHAASLARLKATIEVSEMEIRKLDAENDAIVARLQSAEESKRDKVKLPLISL